MGQISSDRSFVFFETWSTYCEGIFFSVSKFLCVRIHSLKPASQSLMSFPTSGCNYRHWVDFFPYYLILQRWEDSENQLNEEHLLHPADPQEALSVPDISQPVGQLLWSSKPTQALMLRIKEALGSPSSPSTAPARRRGVSEGQPQQSPRLPHTFSRSMSWHCMFCAEKIMSYAMTCAWLLKNT